MEIKVPLSDLDYGPEEEEAVLRVLRGKWLTMGAVTAEFETRFAEFLGVKHALAVANGTVALHLACLALGIGEGDEVILPSLTFVASANAVLYCGADVRFADIFGTDDLNISPAEIETLITPRTRAILVVHYGGYACRMDEIMALAKKYNLAVIEDTAHAPGAVLDGSSLGTIGDAGCFSFFSNKNLATGEGGMVVTNRDDVAEKVKRLRSHGMTSLTWERHRGHAYTYDVTDLGYNYRIDEIHSALGLAQLHKLRQNNLRRKELTLHYRSRLEKMSVPGLEIPFLSTPGDPAYHIFPILLPGEVHRELVMQSMREKGIQTSIHYPPIHLFQYYRQRFPGISLPKTEAAAAREITLPLYPGMSFDQADDVLTTLMDSMRDFQPMQINGFGR